MNTHTYYTTKHFNHILRVRAGYLTLNWRCIYVLRRVACGGGSCEYVSIMLLLYGIYIVFTYLLHKIHLSFSITPLSWEDNLVLWVCAIICMCILAYLYLHSLCCTQIQLTHNIPYSLVTFRIQSHLISIKHMLYTPYGTCYDIRSYL